MKLEQNPPSSSREKLKTNNILANYIDTDLQFTLEGLEEAQMNKLSNNNLQKPKPLSWYLLNDEKEDLTMNENRKSSIDSNASSLNSVKLQDNKDETTDDTSNSKKKGKKGGRQKVKKVSVNFTIAGSENKTTSTQSNNVDDKLITTQSQLIAASVAKDRKEDYWYYDPISDGFYYENNGSRGWKKRNPKVHGPPPTSANKKLTTEQEKVNLNQKMYNPVGPTLKYYDPATDGYYYEMASVDGWRRRQPINNPLQTNQPSYDKKCMQPPPMSSQHFPPLDTASQTATPTPSPAGSFIPQNTLLTHTQLEDLIIRHPSLLSMENKQKIRVMNQDDLPPSNSSTSSISEDITTPPPQGNSMFMQHFRRNGTNTSLQQSSSSASIMNNKQQSGTFSVGSSDEPYEFYWSDTEKPSSISSFDDFDIQNRAVGSRRPETLSFAPIQTPHQQQTKAWWDTNTVEPIEHNSRFDVERLLADLPSFDEDKVIRNLCALPTPIGEKRRDTDDSTLYTPLKENDWFTPYVRTPIKNDQIDYEKIWRTPCA